jgi:DNA mismatch repair protein MutS2
VNLMPTIVPGDAVRTPLGKGVVREVRTNGRLVVLIGDRSVVVDAGSATVVAPPKASTRTSRAPAPDASAPRDDERERRRVPVEIDLHGLVVADAVERVVSAVAAALLAGHARIRIIHGRSGGRLRAAVHRELRAVPSIRGFRLDPANEGVTIVEL